MYLSEFGLPPPTPSMGPSNARAMAAPLLVAYQSTGPEGPQTIIANTRNAPANLWTEDSTRAGHTNIFMAPTPGADKPQAGSLTVQPVYTQTVDTFAPPSAGAQPARYDDGTRMSPSQFTNSRAAGYLIPSFYKPQYVPGSGYNWSDVTGSGQDDPNFAGFSDAASDNSNATIGLLLLACGLFYFGIYR